MEHADFVAALRQLAAAAEMLATNGPENMREDAFECHAFFRRFEQPGVGIERGNATSDDALFVQTAHAALTMAGRNEYAASRALLQQAQSLLLTP
ncbi:hypothetical protein [Paraburkholderia solisilvae]|uniref:Uncharacterized protein n=1 Tax=Paraburkholderia solisilvae TaxID=624376 RepID=A0A6J5DE07_9BURK|nr:hypothetical protein [Paraburkholderia solisilvae]CAB3751215.1 hypothetical protein LMG29739_01254 [Paraburkholderia solisilvae]